MLALIQDVLPITDVLPLSGIRLLTMETYNDLRGSFFQSFSDDEFAAHELPTLFAEENQSISSKNVLRGLHFQEKFPQGKLVQVLTGAIYDVMVDLRRNSGFFGNIFAVRLEADKAELLWIPPGFAHGFLSLEARTRVLYKVTAPRVPEDERVIAWNDPDLDIPWPLEEGEELILSERDKRGLSWKDWLSSQKG